MISTFGAIASILFILATAGQTAKVVREGHAAGVSHILIWMLLVGFVLMVSYVIFNVGLDLILLSSYTFQAILWAIVARYKYFPRRKTGV